MSYTSSMYHNSNSRGSRPIMFILSMVLLLLLFLFACTVKSQDVPSFTPVLQRLANDILRAQDFQVIQYVHCSRGVTVTVGLLCSIYKINDNLIYT